MRSLCVTSGQAPKQASSASSAETRGGGLGLSRRGRSAQRRLYPAFSQTGDVGGTGRGPKAGPSEGRQSMRLVPRKPYFFFFFFLPPGVLS